MGASIRVVNNASDGRFEAGDGGELAILRYRVEDGTLFLIHTEVPKALEGRGYASALAHTALEYAQREHFRVVPWCPFVRAYLRRHPEYAPLVQHERGPE